jgi:hypothetical protein
MFVRVESTLGFGMIITMDFCGTGVGRRGKIGRGPRGEEILFFTVNWDPLMCRRLSIVFMPKPRAADSPT